MLDGKVIDTISLRRRFAAAATVQDAANVLLREASFLPDGIDPKSALEHIANLVHVDDRRDSLMAMNIAHRALARH